MRSTPPPLTPEQARSLLRYLGRGPDSTIVLGLPGAHFAPVAGEVAIRLTGSYTLPGGRLIRYGLHECTIFVTDASRPAHGPGLLEEGSPGFERGPGPAEG